MGNSTGATHRKKKTGLSSRILLLQLVRFIDNNPVAMLAQIADVLSDKFEDLKISRSGMDKHLEEDCSYTLNIITKIPPKRNSPDIIELKFRAVEAWIKDSHISFMQNCVFIDKFGFNLHTVRSQSRSKKDELAKVVIATTMGTINFHIDAICSLRVVNVGLKLTRAGTKYHKHKFFCTPKL
ncbi:hypothetical protein G6F44_005009 [Rhizopus delemar]|nr:hypothetical protein G6F44_005009 [Rhizopus delemar]